MADKKKMSIEDILAACRGTGGGSSPSGGAEESATTASQPNESASKPAVPPAGGTSSGKPASQMSVADILAAARGAGATTTGAGAKADQGAGQPGVAQPAAPGKAASAKGAGAMSVSDILAAARGAGGTEAAKPAPKAAAKPKATAAPSEGAAKPAAAKPAGPMDTSSILAAARKDAKPGPVSKAEAAAKAAGSAARSKPLLPPMPEKPAYAKPKAASVSATDRRGFFSVFLGSFLAIGFTTLGLTSLSWTLGLARFLFPNILMEPPSRFKVGFPNDFAPGSVADRFKAQFGIWIVSTEYEGMPQIVALRTVCTHLGCTPNWLEAEQKFKCPCHGSGFYKDGINFEGPAPRPLERYAIRLADDGQLEVDKSKMFQQEMGQWSDPACYVPV